MGVSVHYATSGTLSSAVTPSYNKTSCRNVCDGNSDVTLITS